MTIDGQKVSDLITDESGKTGEKVELGAYECLTAPSTTSYNHLGNKLSTICGFNQPGVDYHVGRDVAMQVASMNPVAVDRDSVAKEVVESEFNIAVEKTKEEQVRKAVENALKKAGLNPNHFDSEEHIESNIAKGWITEADAARGPRNHGSHSSREGSTPARADDSEHRQRPCQQVLQRELPDGTGIRKRRQPHHRPVPRAERKGSYSSKLQARKPQPGLNDTLNHTEGELPAPLL